MGPIVRETEETVEKTRETLVYISMGTVNNDLLPLYRACVEAFRDGKHQVILSAGEQVDLAALGELPENVAVYPRVDQIAVLEKADVFVSHCGMNSASESLYFGVPLVLLPQTAEQGGVAERVFQLGAGIRPAGQDASGIRAAVEQALTDQTYRESAERIRDGFHRCGGARAAADKILQVCGKK